MSDNGNRQAMINGAYDRGHDAGRAARDVEVKQALASTAEWKARAEQLCAALTKINTIRNSIIARQSINWSMHIYPLVAALDEAGFGDEDYDVARPKAEAEVAAMNAANALEKSGDYCCVHCGAEFPKQPRCPRCGA